MHVFSVQYSNYALFSNNHFTSFSLCRGLAATFLWCQIFPVQVKQVLCGINCADPRNKYNALITFLMEFYSKESLIIYIIILLLIYIQRSWMINTDFFAKYLHCPVKKCYVCNYVDYSSKCYISCNVKYGHISDTAVQIWMVDKKKYVLRLGLPINKHKNSALNFTVGLW
jgi:hypothetical protein